MALRWEAHTEFYTLTLYQQTDQPDWQQDLRGLPVDWSDSLPGELITGVQIHVRAPDDEPMEMINGKVPQGVFGNHQVIGSQVMRGAATIWTDFRAEGEFGLDRILVQDNRLHDYQCGRLLQRLCEIDTYRAVALLGLEPARETMRKVSALDQELALQMSDGFDEQAVAEAGKKQGAEFVVLGYIGKLQSTYTIDVRMINCTTGGIDNSYSETYKGDIDGLIVLMEKLAKRMAGIEEKSKLWMYLTGGGVVTVATVAYLLLQPEEVGLPEPPGPPQ